MVRPHMPSARTQVRYWITPAHVYILTNRQLPPFPPPVTYFCPCTRVPSSSAPPPPPAPRSRLCLSHRHRATSLLFSCRGGMRVKHVALQ